jgi:hypothetical protein
MTKEEILNTNEGTEENNGKCSSRNHVGWVPVTTARLVLRSRMGKQPPAMEGSCEYIE